MGPVQNGVGVKGGISITTFGVQAILDANPSSIVIQGGIRNGYNEMKSECVLFSIRDSEKLDSTIAFSHALMLQAAYVGMGNGTQLVKSLFWCEEGVQQGAIKSR